MYVSMMLSVLISSASAADQGTKPNSDPSIADQTRCAYMVDIEQMKNQLAELQNTYEELRKKNPLEPDDLLIWHANYTKLRDQANQIEDKILISRVNLLKLEKALGDETAELTLEQCTAIVAKYYTTGDTKPSSHFGPHP